MWRLGRSEDEVPTCMDEIRSLAQELGRPGTIAVAVAGLAGFHRMLGRAEAALE